MSTTETIRFRTIASGPRVILHRDGSVTLFDCITQSWRERVRFVPDETLAALPETFRRRIIRHLGI